MLKISRLKSGYGKKQILNGISLEVKKGEIVAIIGHNGAGKTTLLKTIFGLVPIWDGEIFINEFLYQQISPIENVKNGLSFLLQGNRVFSELTVLENLEMGSYLLKRKIEYISRLNTVFKLFPKLEIRKKQIAGTLSSGEQQMLALANVVIMQPKILLLDEPSLSLSPKFVHTTMQIIQDLNRRFGTSILIVEQKVREVLKIANRVYVFKLGEVAFEGKPEELLEGERLKEMYLT